MLGSLPVDFCYQGNEIGDCTYTPLLRNERIVNGSYMGELLATV